MNAIEVEGLSKAYRIRGARERDYNTLRDVASRALDPRRWVRTASETVWALRDVSFQVGHGDVLGLIGRNGAGKSTLLKILSRITEPTEGLARVRGRVASLLEVGTGFHPELTGRENVFLNGAIIGMKRAEVSRKFDEIVAFAEVEKYIDTPVKRYSSGMYVRLAFAVAAHLDSDILLVDEVLAVGDFAFQKKCLRAIKDAPRGGRTVVFVSHNLPTVERLCPNAILLRGGIVVASGPSAEVIRGYLRVDQDATLHWERTAESGKAAWFQSVRVTDLDAGEAAVSFITSQSRVAVDIDCVIAESRRDVRLAVLVSDESGSALFSTSPIDDGAPFPTVGGRHRYRVVFPKALFMPQRYSLTISLYVPGGGLEMLDNAISFDVMEVASLANLAGGRRMGALQLYCAWTHRHDAEASLGASKVVEI